MNEVNRLVKGENTMLKAQYKPSGFDAGKLDKELTSFLSSSRRKGKADREQLCKELHSFIKKLKKNDMCVIERSHSKKPPSLILESIRSYAGIISDGLPGHREVWCSGSKIFVWRTK
jgi:hypothetical protein